MGKLIVGVGTELSIGTVAAIESNGVLVDTSEGVKLFSFSEVEKVLS